MTPPAWRNQLSAKSQKNKRKISLQKETAAGRDGIINKRLKGLAQKVWNPRGCLFSKQKLTDHVLFNRWEKWNEQSLCLGLGTCPQWPELLSQQEWLLFSLLKRLAASVWAGLTSELPHKIQEGCVWPGHPSHFARSLRIPTSCPAHTLEQPEEASPAIPWHTACMIEKMSKSRFGLASLGAPLFSINVSYKKAFETGRSFFL